MTAHAWSILGLLALAGVLVAAPVEAVDRAPAADTAVHTDEGSLTGTWYGGLGVSVPCEDWSHVIVALEESGSHLSGTLYEGLGHEHGLDGWVGADSGYLSVGGLPGSSECGYLSLFIQVFERDASGRLVAFGGRLQGRCQGTVDAGFRFVQARQIRPALGHRRLTPCP